eukprot:CAMPEP_0194046262 /NCGR_PEP_ID=MMETSP0009_2-20130614/20080_1 /TAXON_ID=210454 /ORGANISM="Grammatophora oceanica, Strain CCMP 410" /LENGTH=387 /DNA_ID=CAMNT_0038691471 /DNA_START=66 /DNA_END=1229 /DNA_ORIENTATION=-
MMKSIGVVLSLAANTAAYGGGLREMMGMGLSIDATTEAAKHLFAKATNGERRLEDEVNNDVLAGYSLIYQGCHNSTSWSDEGVQYMGLVQFKLCHSYYCGDNGKCRSQMAGDYVVDLNTFVDSYLESKLELNRYKCEMLREQCGCNGENDDCMYYCYKTYGDDDLKWSECQDEQGNEEQYGECRGLEIENDDDDDGGRRLGDDGGYYTGPYCGPDGEGVYMSIFKDEECANHVDDPAKTYYLLSGGKKMKYSLKSGNSLVKNDCLECKEPVEQNDDDAADENELTRICEETYQRSAKCETYMTDMGYYRDTSGCSLIAQLNMMSSMSMQMVGFSGSSGWTLGSFGVLMACVFVAVGAATYYAKKAKKQQRRNAPSLMEAEMTPQVPS